MVHHCLLLCTHSAASISCLSLSPHALLNARREWRVLCAWPIEIKQIATNFHGSALQSVKLATLFLYTAKVAWAHRRAVSEKRETVSSSLLIHYSCGMEIKSNAEE